MKIKSICNDMIPLKYKTLEEFLFDFIEDKYKIGGVIVMMNNTNTNFLQSIRLYTLEDAERVLNNRIAFL